MANGIMSVAFARQLMVGLGIMSGLVFVWAGRAQEGPITFAPKILLGGVTPSAPALVAEDRGTLSAQLIHNGLRSLTHTVDGKLSEGQVDASGTPWAGLGAAPDAAGKTTQTARGLAEASPDFSGTWIYSVTDPSSTCTLIPIPAPFTIPPTPTVPPEISGVLVLVEQEGSVVEILTAGKALLRGEVEPNGDFFAIGAFPEVETEDACALMAYPTFTGNFISGELILELVRIEFIIGDCTEVGPFPCSVTYNVGEIVFIEGSN